MRIRSISTTLPTCFLLFLSMQNHILIQNNIYMLKLEPVIYSHFNCWQEYFFNFITSWKVTENFYLGMWGGAWGFSRYVNVESADVHTLQVHRMSTKIFHLRFFPETFQPELTHQLHNSQTINNIWILCYLVSFFSI